MIKHHLTKIPGVKFSYVTTKKIYFYIVYLFEFYKFKKKSSPERFKIDWKNRRPCLNDKTKNTEFSRHYIYHPAWAARILNKTKPKKHIDISSILNFSTIISAFIPVEFYDYRPAKIELDNFSSKHANLLKLPFADNSIESLSCMHTVEHVGLGRYGDELNPDADLKAFKELERVLKTNGNLLIVVPIGKPKIIFNAHRIYSYGQIIKYFKNLKLIEFSLIPDRVHEKGIVKNSTEKFANQQNYACGCFWFTKI